MNNLTNATAIAKTYMLTHNGEMPLIVVGYNAAGESLALLGNFRKKHELDDQQIFCAILRMAFIANRITEYYVLAQSRMALLDNEEEAAAMVNTDTELPDDQTVAVLIAVGVTGRERHGKIFEISGTSTIELTEVMDIDTEASGTIEGMFMQLLPERTATLPPNIVQNIEYYVKQIRYFAPVIEEPPPMPSGLEGLFSTFNTI